MKLNLGPGLQQISQQLAGMTNTAAQVQQKKLQMAFAADENLYNANALQAKIGLQDYMQGMLAEAYKNFYSEDFDIENAGDNLSSQVYDFYENNYSQWFKNDRYKERFLAEQLDPIVADMRYAVNEKMYTVKNEIAVETANSASDDALKMLQKGARPEGVYEILMDSLSTIQAVYPMSKTQYNDKVHEINNTFNTTVVQTGLAAAVNSGRFSGEDILNIVMGINGKLSVDGDEPWQVQAKIIKDQLKVREDPTRSTAKEKAYLNPFSDDQFEELNSYAKSLLGIREAERVKIIQEHGQKMVVYFDELVEKDPDSFTLKSVIDYVAGDKVLTEHQDDAAYSLIKGLADKAKSNQDVQANRQLGFTIGDQDLTKMLAPEEGAESVTIGNILYGGRQDVEINARKAFRTQARPKYFSEDAYQTGEDIFVAETLRQYDQKIMQGLFAEYDQKTEEYYAASEEYRKQIGTGENVEKPLWTTDRTTIDTDTRFDMLGPELSVLARDAVYDSFTRNELTPEAEQGRVYTMLRPKMLNQYVSKDARLIELGTYRAKITDDQYKLLKALVEETPVFENYKLHAEMIELFANEILGVDPKTPLDTLGAMRLNRVRGQIQQAYDDFMFENSDTMTSEMAQSWIENNLDKGNTDFLKYLLYRVGDKSEWLGKDGRDYLSLIQTGRYDKDIWPEAYAMAAEYTDSLMRSEMNIDPKSVENIMGDEGIWYMIKASQHQDLSEWAGDAASDVMVGIRFMIQDGIVHTIGAVENTDEDGLPTGEYTYFELGSRRARQTEAEPQVDPIVSGVAPVMAGTSGIGPTFQQMVELEEQIKVKQNEQTRQTKQDATPIPVQANPGGFGPSWQQATPQQQTQKVEELTPNMTTRTPGEQLRYDAGQNYDKNQSVSIQRAVETNQTKVEPVAQKQTTKSDIDIINEIPTRLSAPINAAVRNWINSLKNTGNSLYPPNIARFPDLKNAGVTQEQLDAVYRLIMSEGGKK